MKRLYLLLLLICSCTTPSTLISEFEFTYSNVDSVFYETPQFTQKEFFTVDFDGLNLDLSGTLQFHESVKELEYFNRSYVLHDQYFRDFDGTRYHYNLDIGEQFATNNHVITKLSNADTVVINSIVFTCYKYKYENLSDSSSVSYDWIHPTAGKLKWRSEIKNVTWILKRFRFKQ